jgi:hypothetical protein
MLRRCLNGPQSSIRYCPRLQTTAGGFPNQAESSSFVWRGAIVSLRCRALSTSNQRPLNLKRRGDEDIGNSHRDGSGDERDRVRSFPTIIIPFPSYPGSMFDGDPVMPVTPSLRTGIVAQPVGDAKAQDTARLSFMGWPKTNAQYCSKYSSRHLILPPPATECFQISWRHGLRSAARQLIGPLVERCRRYPSNDLTLPDTITLHLLPTLFPTHPSRKSMGRNAREDPPQTLQIPGTRQRQA